MPRHTFLINIEWGEERMNSILDFINKFKKTEETDEERRIKLEKRAFTKKNRSHRFCILVFITFFLSYGLFWTSNIWLPMHSSNDYPKIGESYEVNDDYSVKMIRYDFCQSEKVAEIELDIIQSKYQSGEWHLSAAQNKNPLNVSFPIDNEQNLIIRIANIGKETTPITVILSFVAESESQSSVTWNFKPQNVTQVKNMPEKTPTEYRIQRCNLNIKQHKAQIEKYKKQIETQKGIVADIERQNRSLQQLLNQQTSEEQLITNKQIEENLTASNNASNRIKKYEQKIITVNSKITGEEQKRLKLKDELEG